MGSSWNGLAKSKSPLNTPGGISGEVGGHKFKCLGKLPNGWTDWHQIWCKSADSSGNRHRLNTIRPSIPQGDLWGHKFKGLGKLSKRWTDWHQIWYTSADSSGNGRRLNRVRPSISQGAFWGFRRSHIKKYVEAIKRLDRLAPNLAHMCRFIWEWIYAKQIPLRDTRGHLGVYGVKHSKVWRSCQTAGPIGTNCGSRLRIHLGVDIG